MILTYTQKTNGSNLVKKTEHDVEINEIKGEIPDINHLNKKNRFLYKKITC